MTRFSNANFIASYRTGQRAKEVRPAKPETGKRTSAKVIDTEALAAAMAELDALAAQPRRMKTGNDLPATGHCHTCERAISGERRFCGPCAARRSR